MRSPIPAAAAKSLQRAAAQRPRHLALASGVTTTTTTTTTTTAPHARGPHAQHHQAFRPGPATRQTNLGAYAPASRSRRAYHSTDHPSPAGPFGTTEQEMLAAAYKHVPAHGFSAEALARGARDLGYLDISASVVPDGAFGLIKWHLVTRREALAARAAQLFGGDGAKQQQQQQQRRQQRQQRQQLSVRDKVEALAWERLLGNVEVIGRWQEALAIMAQPSYVPASLKELAQLVDDIWYLAGDAAIDPSWYTKRAALSAVYTSAELFMTNDKSPGFEDTHAFLRRRLAETNELGSAVRSTVEWVNFSAAATVNVLRSKGVRI